jgi:hypothetical protein
VTLSELIKGRREIDDGAVLFGSARPVEMPTAVLPAVALEPEYVGRHRASADRAAYAPDRAAVRSHRRTRGGAR